LNASKFSFFAILTALLMSSLIVSRRLSCRLSQPCISHFHLTATKTGVSSETVKSVSAALGIPTVSASFGQDGDLRQWRDIPDKKKNYLLQVMPPSDVLTEIVRAIVTYNNITNAAILYDDTYVVDHKYKALLQNIPTRHVITAIANDKERADQLVKLRNLDINNYFVLGTLESIKKVLGKFFLFCSKIVTAHLRHTELLIILISSFLNCHYDGSCWKIVSSEITFLAFFVSEWWCH
jgi:hypothetical protein